ncbi:MAG: PBP1A family penicillin-binding protein [Alphaproteobacteria bacterium]
MSDERHLRRGSWLGGLLWWLLVRLAIAGVALAAVGALACVIAYFIITPRTFDKEAIYRMGRTPGVTFLDAKGQVLATRGAYHGDQVTLKSLPPYLVNAFIATEDRRFYSHHGVDPLGIMRAIVVNLRAGHTVQGGSTLTQQLAKNLFLTNDRTYTRKFNELFYAIWLERHLTKNEILTLYLNRVYFGAGTYGVDAAARYYFNKPASQVTLAEAAVLAGLPQSPSRFRSTADATPTTVTTDIQCGQRDRRARTYSFPAVTQTRASHVLDKLVEAGFMTEAQVFAARANPAKPASRLELTSIQYYLDYVYDILGDVLSQSPVTQQAAGSAGAGLYGLPPGLADKDLIVHTTMDKSLQQDAEDALLVSLECDGPSYKASEGALVAIDPDGALRAMIGGRDYTVSQFNRATSAKRQPGSSFKPFVYLTALENGYTPDSIVEDAPITIQTPQGPWSPNDYETGEYRGNVTLRDALAYSLNTAAVRLSEQFGPDKVVATARRLGITSDLEPLHSIALGSQVVTPLELTGAYLAFARNGLSVPVHTVDEVDTKDGTQLYKYQPTEPTRVIDPQIATNMTNMMYAVIDHGTGRNASLGDRPAAGKTGTSSDWRDAWFVGYTGNLLAGVWIGNDDNSEMNHVTGGSLPAAVWKSFMSAAHEGVPIVSLPGAYSTRSVSAASELKAFYGDLAASFRAASQGTSPVGAVSGAPEQAVPSELPPANPSPERPCKRRFLGICVSR